MGGKKICNEFDILDNALVMIAILGENGRVISWNHAAETITGYSPKEAVGTNVIWKKLYPNKGYRMMVTGRIANILKTKNYFENFETTIQTRSGESRTLLWNTKIIQEGGMKRAIAVGMDVTAEQEAKSFRDSIIENANVLITVLDPKGTIQVWNKAAEIITGYSADEVIGRKDIWKKIYPETTYRHNLTQKISEVISLHSKILRQQSRRKPVSSGSYRGTPGKFVLTGCITRLPLEETSPNKERQKRRLLHT